MRRSCCRKEAGRSAPDQLHEEAHQGRYDDSPLSDFRDDVRPQLQRLTDLIVQLRNLRPRYNIRRRHGSRSSTIERTPRRSGLFHRVSIDPALELRSKACRAELAEVDRNAKRLEHNPNSDPSRVRIVSDNARYSPYERLAEETKHCRAGPLVRTGNIATRCALPLTPPTS